MEIADVAIISMMDNKLPLAKPIILLLSLMKFFLGNDIFILGVEELDEH